MSNKTNPLENLEEELVDYVSNTPNNTNPSVVKSMVRAAADDVSTGSGYILKLTVDDYNTENADPHITCNCDEMVKALEKGMPVTVVFPEGTMSANNAQACSVLAWQMYKYGDILTLVAYMAKGTYLQSVQFTNCTYMPGTFAD